MSNDITKLPSNGDVDSWSAAEKAIVEAAGLVFMHTYGDRAGHRELAPRPVVEQFLSIARRSGLDPLARQIYCIGRLSQGRVEWSIQTGIDGFRLVAERSKKYDGQDGAEWLTSKGEWEDAFVPSIHGPNPLAARVKVYRKDWPRPSVGVAEWGAYAQTKRSGDLTSMWAKQGAGQLAKCAEALAIRKAFPQDLSGLYTADEMGGEVIAVAEATPSRDWAADLRAAQTHEEIEDLVDSADDAGELTDVIRTAALTRHGMISRGESEPAEDEPVAERDEETVAEEARRAFEEAPSE
ncbi:phage recombination protein Bet [Paramicrobacterium chengjingii]|uniref:Phage recombination protein Bet n=1 Tax=Paramicrobacterium chengjingii TaxID=2769067 RepID=A0ABX6YLL6_9MICO|nr:phage recombination protein Bet [Microbacterium chengjingii]QPZ39728.1 phage recombination protein Bet [Microbacterium chengjingii]